MRLILMMNGILFFWLFSPESLAVLGRSAGIGPTWFVLLFFLMAVLVGSAAWLSAQGIRAVALVDRESFMNWNDVRLAVGISGIVGTTLFASTGILVTAGFTFNEVFFYRFPNFGFSSLLLILVLVTQLVFGRINLFFQSLLVLVSISCLILLSIAGLMVDSPELAGGQQGAMVSLGSALPILLVFAGFEQPMARLGNKASKSTLLYCFLGAVVLLAIWGVVSTRFVALDRLTVSSIPYMTTAAAVMGQTGRIVMGIAVIAGSCAAVNGLFTLSRLHLEELATFKTNARIRQGIPLLLGVAIATLLFLGVAGSRNLELFIRGSLLLWLLYGAIVVLSVTQASRRLSPPIVWLARVVGTLLVLCTIFLAFHYGHYKMMGLFLVSMLTGATLCIMFVKLMHRRNASQRRKPTNQEEIVI